MKGVVFASASACSLVVSLGGCYWLASYGDLTSGDGNTALDEGGAGLDVGAGPVVDAGPLADAGARIDAAPPPFCPPDAGPLSYCMDFDGVDAGGLGIQSYEGTAGIVNGVYVSPPSSLHAVLSGNGSGAGYGVQFPFQPTTSRLDFQMRAVSLGQWVTTQSINLYESDTQTSRTLNVVLSPDGEFQVQEYIQEQEDGGVQQAGHPPFATDAGADDHAWHHVVLTLTVDGATQTSGLTVDGQVLEDAVPLSLPWAPGTVTIGVGVSYAQGSGPELYFDNVRADFGM